MILFIGKDDRTVCFFYYSGGLEQWKDIDDPLCLVPDMFQIPS